MNKTTDQPTPRLGVGVIVYKDHRILLGRRRNSHGEGHWAFPGGHLEFAESPLECARREVEEETGLQLTKAKPGPFTNDVFVEENKHYVTLFVMAEPCAGEPQPLEPDKCSEWLWFSWSDLPSPLFLPISNLIAQGFDPGQHFPLE